MPKDYRVLSADRKEGQDNYGNVTYFLEIEDEERTYQSVMLKQQPDTPVPSGTLFGELEAKTSKAGKDYWRFFKKRREDGNGAAPRSNAREGVASSGSSVRGGSDSSDERGARIEAQSARRDAIAYAAVVASVTNKLPTLEEIESYARKLALPSGTLGQTPSAGTGAGTHHPSSQGQPQAGGGAQGTASPAPDFVKTQDYKLALAACGKDNSDPVKTFLALNPDEKAQVKGIYQNLANKGEAEIPGTQMTDPDDDIPF